MWSSLDFVAVSNTALFKWAQSRHQLLSIRTTQRKLISCATKKTWDWHNFHQNWTLNVFLSTNVCHIGSSWINLTPQKSTKKRHFWQNMNLNSDLTGACVSDHAVIQFQWHEFKILFIIHSHNRRKVMTVKECSVFLFLADEDGPGRINQIGSELSHLHWNQDWNEPMLISVTSASLTLFSQCALSFGSCWRSRCSAIWTHVKLF